MYSIQQIPNINYCVFFPKYRDSRRFYTGVYAMDIRNFSGFCQRIILHLLLVFFSSFLRKLESLAHLHKEMPAFAGMTMINRPLWIC